MIDPATTSWFEIVELQTITKQTVPAMGKGKKVRCKDYTKEAEVTFDKSSAQNCNLVYKTWFSWYPRCWYLIYNNGSKFKLHCCWYLIHDNESKFKLHFGALHNTYGIKPKPTSVRNPQANAILEQIHAVAMNMLCTAKTDLVDSLKPSDISAFLSDAALAIHSTYYVVL